MKGSDSNNRAGVVNSVWPKNENWKVSQHFWSFTGKTDLKAFSETTVVNGVQVIKRRETRVKGLHTACLRRPSDLK